ncbi:hypothetical protein BH24ACT22_BH24ACT22_07190 [soil metagenome]
MTQNANGSSDAARARGLVMALLITTFFGALWGMVGAFALPGIWSPTAIGLVILVTVALLLGVTLLLRISRSLPPAASGKAGTNPFVTGPYRLAILFEVIAIPLTAAVLNKSGYPGAVVSSVAVIVGLHFFGLIPAFKSRRFAVIGGTMVLVGLVSLLLPTGTETSPRSAFVGLGCALVLWFSAFPSLFSVLRQTGMRPG